MILLIDNYDSFTYNLYQYVSEENFEVVTKRNDQITIQQIEQMRPTHIVISPGPGHPKDAGITPQVITRFYREIPILGICLGHQAIGLVFGAEIVLAKDVVHGKESVIHHDGKGILKDIPSPFNAVRYHSLAISPNNLPSCLTVRAKTDDGTIMAIEHNNYPIYGVQFHPESILSQYGKKLIHNFLCITRGSAEQYNAAESTLCK